MDNIIDENLNCNLNVLVVTSKMFYDRYIEVSFPSPIDAGYNARTIDYVYVDEYSLNNNKGQVFDLSSRKEKRKE